MEKISRKGTGKKIRKLLADRGITVRMVQERMGLESPQAVYKWLNGKALPSADNLLSLSRILELPIEALLVQEDKGRGKEGRGGEPRVEEKLPERPEYRLENRVREFRCHLVCEIPTRDLIRMAGRFQERYEQIWERPASGDGTQPALQAQPVSPDPAGAVSALQQDILRRMNLLPAPQPDSPCQQSRPSPVSGSGTQPQSSRSS